MNKFLIGAVFMLVQLPVPAIEDEFADTWFSNKEIARIEPHLEYDYTSIKRTKITLQPQIKISVPHNIHDGQKVKLTVKRNARIGRELLAHGTQAEGIVEMYMTNGMAGLQGIIILGQIQIEGIDSKKLQYYCIKEGQNRTLWIWPLKWALTPIPFAGSVTSLIKGGQASLTPKDELSVFYYDEW